MRASKIINVKGTEIVLLRQDMEDFISLTDIAKYRDPNEPAKIISLWLRTYNSIEYLGLWETLHNPRFKPHIYEGFKQESARPHFWMSPQKWINETNAIGMSSRSGRYKGGTFAHSDIAFKFAAWISAEFELYIIKDYQRLKADEGHRLKLEWNAKRELSKVNYRIHTDAIKEHLIPPMLSQVQIGLTYASEADMLNMALFGLTAKQWREQNPDMPGNMRDHANVYQLIVLVNMESMNAELIKQGLSQKDRLAYLNRMAIEQMTSLVNSAAAKRLNDTIS